MSRSIRRILDANANRAREALRVMEESARFLLDDADLSSEIKILRHELSAVIRRTPGPPLELTRDTPQDVGTRQTTRTETQRTSPAQITQAAGKRLSEALRCLEEYAKLSDPAIAADIKQLRYRAYHAEARLHGRLTATVEQRRERASRRLCVLISEKLCRHHPWLDVARACIDAGADCLQLREKELSDAELLHRARRLVSLAREAANASGATGGLPARARPSVIINDRPDIALLAGADGVHLGENDLPIHAVRELAGDRLLIGVSTHTLEEARRAVQGGADYCGVGSIFASSTKHRTTSGLEYLRRFVREYPHVPCLAIGGIAPENVDQVLRAVEEAESETEEAVRRVRSKPSPSEGEGWEGVRREGGGTKVGLAVSSCACSAEAPAAVVRELLAARSSQSHDL